MFGLYALMAGLCFGQVAALYVFMKRRSPQENTGGCFFLGALYLVGVVFFVAAIMVKVFGGQG
jgi:hypothetical protein